MTVTVLLADDHPIVRHGLRHLLGEEPNIKIVGEASEGLQAVQLTEKLRPNVLILDIMMPDLNGLEVLRQVKERAPATCCIVLSMQSADVYVVEALKAGALGYVLKETGPSELLNAVQQVVAGHRYLSPRISERLIDVLIQTTERAPADPYQTLTNREREVLQMAAEGLSTAEIAKRLSISPRTAELHRGRMMNKLGLHNPAELIRYALKRGILPLDD
ncbi:MAG TPA: response regulator transcription factor [Anaerolineales bacterium]|jgi:DNA-binding NarL/FixJ family response regulator|nr:response regulator transcription factor [Anaerolineales bacterium]